MLKKTPYMATIDKALKNGLLKLEAAASGAYGNQKGIQYQDARGIYHVTNSFGEILQNAKPADPDAARAAAVLRGSRMPDDGVKTGIIILSGILEKALKTGCTSQDLDGIQALLEYGSAYLERVAQETGGGLLGSALPYMTLIRPLDKRGRECGCERSAAILEHALSKPLFTLAEATGADGYGVYERMKALSPNQFFSLCQVGIERSISTDSPYTDIWVMGYDPADGQIKDCREIEYREKLYDVQHVLLFVKYNLKAISNISISI